MGLFRFFARRLVFTVPTVLGIVVFLFVVLRVLPSDPAAAILGDYASATALQDLRARLGLDRSLGQQFVAYLGDLARGDLGDSFRTGRPVAASIAQFFPHTFWLAIGAVLFSALVGVPLGVVSAVWKDTWIDHVARVVALFGISVPVFYLGILLLIAFVLRLPLFPLSGAGPAGDPVAYLHHLVLPVIALGVTQAALIMRMTRASMLEVIKLDFVRTARSKGIGHAQVIWRHVVRNAMLPVVTVIGVNIGTMLAGTVLTESVFNRPGIGLFLIEAIKGRDYPVVQGLMLILTLLVTIINLLVDLVYALINPRVSYA